MGAGVEEPWRRGIDELRAGDYWEAHEAWETVWHELPESEAREATQALIQFAAACYKIRQVDDGRTAGEMRRGIEGLVERARGHLEAADGLDGPETSWERGRLEEGLDRLEELRKCWASGRSRPWVAREIRDTADALAAHLDSCTGPTA